MKTKLIAVSLIVLTACAVVVFPHVNSWAGFARTAPPAPVFVPPIPLNPLANTRPLIEVVFVLDTTGSMGGLIDTAKEKIWSIASTMAAAQPAPEIRMGLVAYRDRGDAYVTKVVDLSSDLDSMYATLMDFQAAGGGDGPESVNAALHDAVNNVSWSQGQGAYQVVFLVGDAPPHMDYMDEAKYPAIVRQAASRGIVVNTIRCGNNGDTQVQWRQIASLSQGQYFSVDQGGGAIAIASPYDADIARLSRAMDDTRMVYGNAEHKLRAANKAKATSKLQLEASEAVLARRGAFNATATGKRNLFGDKDLVADIAAGRVNLADVEEAELPEPVRAMAPAARMDGVLAVAAERDQLRASIAQVIVKRDEYLEGKAEAVGELKSSLDYQLFETVKKQAAEKGLSYEGAPKY